MVLVEIRRKRPDPRDEVCRTGSQTASYWRSPSPGTHILVWFPPPECGQDWDWFLANRTWQREWAVASMTTWQKTVASVPLVHSPCCDEKMAVVRTGESKDWLRWRGKQCWDRQWWDMVMLPTEIRERGCIIFFTGYTAE